MLIQRFNFTSNCKLFKISISSVGQIIKIFNSKGRVNMKILGGVRRKSLTNEEKSIVYGYIEQDCNMTSKEVKNKIYNEFNKGVSLKTID
jgi:transposase